MARGRCEVGVAPEGRNADLPASLPGCRSGEASANLLAELGFRAALSVIGTEVESGAETCLHVGRG